jgi:hypothetical protein
MARPTEGDMDRIYLKSACMENITTGIQFVIGF